MYISESLFIPRGDSVGLRLLHVRPASHNPSAGDRKPVVLCFHAGGGILATPELELGTYITFASNGYVVISVDYRLAPEDPYPAAFNDGETAWNWLHTKEAATSLGLDVTRFGLFGTSAGSWLSTGLAIRLKDKNSFEQPRIAICDSCIADDRVIYVAQDENHPWAHYFQWSGQNARDAQRMLYGGNQPELPVEAAPLRSTNLEDFQGLCPHYIISAEIDSLVENGILYSHRLLQAGVRLEFHLFKGAPHAFGLFGTSLSKVSQNEYLRVLPAAMV